MTMYDSLDTMWLMGLEDMFYDTVEDVARQTWGMEPVCFLRDAFIFSDAW